MGQERRAPGWPTVISAVCLVAVLGLGWVVQHLWTAQETEAVYREDVRVRVIRLLTVLEHADCQDIDQLRETVREMRRDLEAMKESGD